MRVTVLGPLGAVRGGRAPNGVRRVESDPALARRLAGTIGALDARALTVALDFGSGKAVCFASNGKEWSRAQGTFELV